jgi:hypothetical protein
MMGGLGSGRPRDTSRSKVEDCRSLDVNRLHREGCLQPGWTGGWTWTEDGEEVASVGLRVAEDKIRIFYRVRIAHDDWEDVVESVGIARLSCHYGGCRPYFICPGVLEGRGCGRRVVKLLQGGHYFLCRRCYLLAYSSQSEQRLDRALRRANLIKQKLGGKPGLASLFPGRPKGMWRRTYDRLHERVYEIEISAEEEIEALSERVRERLDRSMKKSGASLR